MGYFHTTVLLPWGLLFLVVAFFALHVGARILIYYELKENNRSSESKLLKKNKMK